MLFITGPGKTAIENHFDINAELIQTLRETGKEELLGRTGVRAGGRPVLLHAAAAALGLGHAVLCARPLVGHQPFVVALGDSIIGLHAQSEVVRRMTRCSRSAGAARSSRSRRCRGEEVSTTASPSRGPAATSSSSATWSRSPSVDEAPSNLAVAARYVLRRDLRRPRQDAAGQGRRDPADRRDPHRDPRGRPRLGVRLRPRASSGSTSATSRATSRRSSSSPWPTRSTAPALRALPGGTAPCILTRKRAYARAGLVGNPSDGYHGKTISLIVRNFWAEVVLYEWDPVEIVLAEEDRAASARSTSWRSDVRLHGYYGGIRLIKATIKVRRVLPGAQAAAARPQLLGPLPDEHPAAGRAWPAPARSSWPRSAA